MIEKKLNSRERELVALGASIASNCIPCVKYHIAESRKAGLSEGEIQEAVNIADMVRQVPASKVLGTARAMLGLSENDDPSDRFAEMRSCCENVQDNSGPHSEQEQEKNLCNILEMMQRFGPEMVHKMKARLEEFCSSRREDKREDNPGDEGRCKG